MLRPLLWKRLKPNSANRAIQQPRIRHFHLDPNICTGQHTARSRWRSHFKRCNKTVKLWWGPVKIHRVLQLSLFHHHKDHCWGFFFSQPTRAPVQFNWPCMLLLLQYSYKIWRKDWTLHKHSWKTISYLCKHTHIECENPVFVGCCYLSCENALRYGYYQLFV